ncbi:HD-GYP domain-containing protein [Ferrimonas marina]|uniref:Putative two-component system response regulator n=1 Tax=Ferrimonas marina TaxID=299255 RepID=A0A1M5VQX0_9GAMM|nr:HD domain-containing phosphohydrolase [Ferrimonas marina]SHH77580.1 putative two-component system response regulator [Ferrimonas marina]
MSDSRPTLLLVDDTATNIDVLVGILRDDYRLRVALDGITALKIVEQSPPDLILLDIMMPQMDGLEVCRRLKQDPRFAEIPVIFVTALGEVEDEAKGLAVGAVDYISKPVNAAVVRARVATHLNLFSQAQHLESLVQKRTSELEQTRLHIIQCLGRAAEYKDNETGYHVIRMSHFAHRLAKAAELPEHFCSLLLNAAPMHDIGKIGIPDQILKKQARLDSGEWTVMRQHPALGADILGQLDSELMQMASRIALSHHERWDGNGYPNRLKGEEIPIEGRIVAIADVFDALTSERPYKHAWSVDDTLAQIASERGRQFDPELVDLFLPLEPELVAIRQRYQDNQAVAQGQRLG